MTLLEEAPVLDPTRPVDGIASEAPEKPLVDDELADEVEEGEETERIVRVPMVALSAALATFSAAWMATRLFRGGMLPIAIALIGIAIGAGLIFASARFGKSGILQYAALPTAIIVGAILATASAGPGSSLPTLIADAVRGGGLLQPPIPFDPGWRFLVVVLFAFVSAGASSMAIGMARPKLAVAIPLPIALGAALIQPQGSEIVSSVVAIVFLVAALAVAYGAVLAADGVVGGGFETRRLLRGAALLVGVIVGLVALAQTDFLFPDTDKDEVIPPMKPPTPPPTPDRELFTVKSAKTGPWRVGVLDVYQDNAFLLPSVDPKRVVDVPESGVVADAPGETYTAELSITDIKGQTLITAANTVRVRNVDGPMEYDPRTQLVKLVESSVPRGAEYTIEAAAGPDAKALAESPDPDPLIAQEFAAMPPPPPGVTAVLAEADTVAENRFDRLQFVRQALYGNVVAAGGGRPIDVPPSRVDDMIAGGEATPYEISAAEVMLARWAGIPARLGFGFHGGDDVEGGLKSFRPRHGAAWLEAYFEGQGWIPIIGTPPKAKPSLSDEQKNEDPNVVPTDELALSVYVPVERQSIQLLFEIVRFYLVRVVPIVLGLLALLIGYPAVLKMIRAGRRRRWAADRGPLQRVIVAYAEVRDRSYDLNIGDPRHTPLEFVADVADDDEHEELAWLVTRAAWGDLARDLRLEDVEAAEEMSRSVLKRVDREQTGLNRLLAWTSRVSLRDPWTDEIPNLWFKQKGPSAERNPVTRLWAARPRVRMLRGRFAGAAGAVLAMLMLGACGGDAMAEAPSTYPDPLVPPQVLGQYDLEARPEVAEQFQRPGDAALVTDGKVFTVRSGDTIQGSVQVSTFRRDVDTSEWDIRAGIEGDLGSVEAFRTQRFGTVRLRVLQTAEEQIFLWFPPERNVMELFIMRKGFEDATKVVHAIIAHQRSAPPGSPGPPEGTPVTTIPLPTVPAPTGASA